MVFNLRFVSPRVRFKEYGSNVDVEFTLQLEVRYNTELDPMDVFGPNRINKISVPDQELLYDELPFEARFNVQSIKNAKNSTYDLMFEFGKIGLARGDIYGRAKDYPVRNSMNMTKNDYLSFLVDFERSLD